MKENQKNMLREAEGGDYNFPRMNESESSWNAFEIFFVSTQNRERVLHTSKWINNAYVSISTSSQSPKDWNVLHIKDV